MIGLDFLPNGWQKVRLGDVVTLERGVSWSKSDEASSGIGVISIPNIGEDGRVNLIPRVRIVKHIPLEKMLTKGDMLLAGSSGSIQNVGRMGVVNENAAEPLTFASFTIRARVNNSNMDQFFLQFLLRSPWIDFPKFSKRAADGKYNLQLQQLRDHLRPLPTLSEQKTIAYILWTVQRAKEATERVIQAMRELKKSLMRHLFTYGPVSIHEAENVPLKDTEIGLVPEHWNLVKLGEICRFQGGTQPPKKEFKYAPQHGYIRLLQIQDFETDEHATFVRCSNRLRSVKEDDVLIARYGASVGKILRGKSGAINVAIVKTIPNENVIFKDYLYFRLQMDDFQEFVKGLGGRAAQAGFNKGELNMFVTSLPLLSEQNEITHILGTIDKKLSVEEMRKQALEALFKTLLHHLMTGKVRVKDLALPETKEAV